MDKEDMASIHEWMVKKDAWFAEQAGERVPVGAGGVLFTEDLGVLHLPSGQVGVTDAFVGLGEGVPVATVAPGAYPVVATMVDLSPNRDRSNCLTAYLTLIVDPAREERRVFAAEEEHWGGVGVDSGTVGFADVDAASRWQLKFPDGREDWIDLLYGTTRPEHGINVDFELGDGSNVVIVQSGFGDGMYPVVLGYDASDKLVRVHVDFGIIGGFQEDHVQPSNPRPTRQSHLRYFAVLIMGAALISFVGGLFQLRVELIVGVIIVWMIVSSSVSKRLGWTR